MIKVTSAIFLNESELEYTFIRASGPGGQNVNKVATAVQLRFDVGQSPSLSPLVRERLLILLGNRATQKGVLIIKAGRYRTQERNKQDALSRLIHLIQRAAIIPKLRKKTKPTRASREKRLNQKKKHGKAKSLRHKLKSEF